MIDYGIEVNDILQLLIFVWLNGCGIAIFFLGLRIYHRKREYKTLLLYLAASIWTLGYGYMGIINNPAAAGWLVRLGLIASLLWLVLLPHSLWKLPLLSQTQGWKRNVFAVMSLCCIVLLPGILLTYHPNFVTMPYGVTYVLQNSIWFLIYTAVSAVFLIILCGVVLSNWSSKLLKREKRFLGRILVLLFLCAAGFLTDALIPAVGRTYVPIGPLTISTAMLLLYYMIIEQEDMGIDTKTFAKHIYESVPMPILLIDRTHRIESANQAACVFFAKAMQELCGKPLEEIVTNSFFSLQDRFLEEINNQTNVYEVSVTCRERKSVCGIKYNVMYDPYGECVFAVLVVNDMSKQYAMFHKLEESRNRAEIANQAKSEFLANMSHEIRTPLNVIIGMNEMIIRESSEPDILEYAGNINTAGNSMVSMVNDIIDMSKMENGQMDMINVDYDVREMVGRVLEGMKDRIENRDLELECIVDPEMPTSLWGDEVRIRQVISKFLSNAEKYTKEGRIVLRVWSECKDEDTIRLSVSITDTGIGIKEKDLAKLFVAFDRVNLKQNRTVSGLGLGLSIVKNIVEAMDGEISVESEYGKGSTFSFTVLQHVRDHTKVGDFNEWYNGFEVLESGMQARNLYAPEAQILAVDDTNVNLEVVKALLRRTQMNVDTAGSGAECLQLVMDKKYDIILMDHMMPQMDGVETLHKLKTLEDNQSIGAVVIALTANAVAGAREDYLASGFDDYLKKPVKSADLEKMLIKYLPAELIQIQTADEEQVTGEEWAARVNFNHINVRTGLVYTDHNHEMLEGIMKQYLNTGYRNIDELNASMEREDWKNYGILVHSLKSTSLNIGAEKLSAHAKMLEAAVQKDRMKYIQVNHPRVMNLYKTVLDELDDYFTEISIGESGMQKRSGLKEEISNKERLRLLTRLQEKLDVSITTEIEKVVAELKKYSYKGKDIKELYKEIFDYIDEYEYEEAYVLVEEAIKHDG